MTLNRIVEIISQYDPDNDSLPDPEAPTVYWADMILAEAIQDLEAKMAAIESPRVTGQPSVILINTIEWSSIYDPQAGIEYVLTHHPDRNLSEWDNTPVMLSVNNAAHSSESDSYQISFNKTDAIDFWGQLLNHFWVAGRLTKAQYDLGHQIILTATSRLDEYESS